MTSACCKKTLRFFIAGVLCTGVLLALASVLPAQALADAGGYYYAADGGKVEASPSAAWNKANELGTGMGITGDFTCDRLYVGKGKKVFVELNGHVVNRNLSSNKNEGEVFYVEDDATLTVYGGTKDDPSAGGDTAHTVRAWVTDPSSGKMSQGTRSVRGGVITGGFSSNYGGGIEMRENSTVNLSYVSVCGNRAAQSRGIDGYGGGINMSRDYGKLNLDHSSIVYNYAYNEGGGVFVNGGAGRVNANYCIIHMRHSHIDYNGAEDNGAGLAVRGKNFQLVGDATQVTNGDNYANEGFWSSQSFKGANAETVWGSTIAYNVVQDSDTGGGGAGVYLEKGDSTVNGANIIGNRALMGGLGGGIYAAKEDTCITGCNVAYNFADTEEHWYSPTVGGQGGGIYVNNDLTTIKASTIAGNSAVRSGGGVWVDGMVDVIAGGTLIVQANRLTSGAQNNMFLGENTGQDARIIVDGLALDSLIGITLDSSHGSAVASGSSARLLKRNAGETIDQRNFTSDGNAKYFYWNSETNPWYDPSVEINRNRDGTGYNERWLLALDRSKMPAGYDASPQVEVCELQPDEGSALRRANSYKVGDKDYGLYQGVFGMPSFVDSTKDVSVEFFYSDGYFMEDPKQYNEHLATMSFALALSAGYSNMGNKGSFDNFYNTLGNGSTYYPVKSANIVELMGDLGVAPDDIFLNDYNHQKPSTSSMGVAIGSKKIGGKTLVIIGTRGTGYEAEWASNVSLGASGEAEGFSGAATIAFGDLQQYLADHGIDGTSEDTLFWISGFSRGGATANLTAKRIVDAYDNGGNRTFAYPMEPPKGGLDSEEMEGCNYTCIHNIINNEDIVPYVAPAEMGFKRYGVDHYTPGTAANSDNIMMSYKTVTIRDSAGNVQQTIPVTTYRDNDPLTGNAYKSARAEMVKQLRAVNGDVIYDDYFYQATLNFVANTINSSNVTSLIGEVSSNNPNMSTAADFISLLFGDLLSKGFNYAPNGSAQTNDYRRFYSTEIMRSSASFQQAASTLCGIAFSLEPDELDGMMEVFGHIMDRISASDLYTGIFMNSNDKWTEYEGYGDVSGGNIKKVTDDLWTAVATRDEKKGFKSLYDVLDSSKVNQIHAVWEPLTFPLLYWAHFDYKQNDSDMAGTLAYNAMRIILNHYPEVVVSYLRGSDSYYKGGANDSYLAFNMSEQKTQSFSLAAEVAHVEGDGTTTTEVVVENDFDKPIRLASANDTLRLCTNPQNESAHVLYRYVGQEEWHEADAPLTFADIMKEGVFMQVSGGAMSSNMEFYAFSPRFVSKIKDITVEYDVYGQLELMRYSGDTGFMSMGESIPVGDSYSLDFADFVNVPESKGTVAKFVRWRVDRLDDTGEYREVEGDELASLFGKGFDAYAEHTTLGLAQKAVLRIRPIFREYLPIDALVVLPATNSELASSVDVSMSGGDPAQTTIWSALPVTWTQDGVDANGKPAYTGKVKLALEDLCPANDGLDEKVQVGNWFPDDVASVKLSSDVYSQLALTAGKDECVLSMRVIAASDESLWKLVVTPQDVVTGTAYEQQTFHLADADESYRPDVPALPHEEFCGWGNGWIVDEATHTKTIVAWYRPVVERVALVVDHGIVLGEGLPVATQVELQSGDARWRAEAADLSSSWKEEGDAAYQSAQRSARTGVVYEAAYGVGDFVPKASGLGEAAPAASFGIADDCAVEVKAGDASIDVRRAVAQAAASEDDLLALVVSYGSVRARVAGVSAGDAVVFSHGVAEEELLDALGGVEVQAAIEGGQAGTVYTLRPNAAEGYDPGNLATQSFSVVCELASDEYDLAGCTTVELPVVVLAAPQVQAPSILPAGGTYAESVRMVLRHPDEKAVLWYAVQAVPVVTGEDGEDQTVAPDFKDAAFVRYDATETIELGSEYQGKRVYVCAYASQDGYNNSPQVVQSYEVMTAYDTVPYVDAAEREKDPVLARSLGAADTDLTYWSQSTGGWYAVVKDLVIDGRVWVQGDVNLILCDGATLEVPAGINVAQDNGASLTIWCQRDGAGALEAGSKPASADEPGADGTGDNGDGAGDNDPIVVVGFDTEDDAAGIGSRAGLDVGEITINGGTITSFGGKDAAGIGGCSGAKGSGVTINNGTVTAVGGSGGAGIGSGRSGHVDYVKVAGGTVDATGGEGATGIGSGADGSVGDVSVLGGTVVATGADDATGIGGNVDALHLSWATREDSIAASSFKCASGIDLAKDFMFVDVPGLVTSDDVLASQNKTLVPWERDTTDVQTECPVGDEGTLDLVDLLAPGDVVGEPVVDDISGILDGKPQIVDGVLSYRIVDGAGLDGVSATITVPVTSSTQDGDYTIIVEVVAREVTLGAVPAFKTQSLVLSGQIGVNFYMDLPAIDGVDYAQSYMEFTVGKKQAARADFNARKKSDDNKYYGFTCYVTSIQMAEPITATFHYGDEQTVVYQNASVQNYVKAFDKDVAANEGKHSKEAVDLVHSVADYGHHAQPFLSEANGWTIGTDYAEMTSCYTESYDVEEVKSLVSDHTLQKTVDGSGITDVSARLRLDSTTALDFMLTVEKGRVVSCDDKKCEVKKVSDTSWIIQVSNISAHKLGDVVKVSGTTDSGSFVLNASPLTYVRAALNSDNISDAGKTALCAFYRYYEATMSYQATLHTS